MKKLIIAACTIAAAANSQADNLSYNTPILIAGGGASGVTAGVAAARQGVNALIIEDTPWVGGMLTSAGVAAIDGNRQLPAGLWGEFRDSLVAHYGSREALRTGWVSDVQFEPSVGERILRNMIQAEPRLKLINGYHPTSATYADKQWTVTFADKAGNTITVTSPIVIDATELGDVAAMAGVPYDLGMESRDVTGEEVAPDKANSIIQDLTYVAVLKDYGRDMTIPMPEGYDPQEFACTAWNPICVTPKEPQRMSPPERMITYGALPNNKFMINWPIEGNDFYVNIIELPYDQREAALKAAKDYTMCYLYFIQTQLGMNTLGLADDEFPTADLLPFIPYHRESRRIHGIARYTVTDMTNPYDGTLYRTCIAVGDYPVDQHHKRYRGDEELPDLHFHPVPSFGLPLGTLIPAETPGLIVAEKSISVSNIANGATRLQPVVLQIGQAAGTLAALATKQNVEPRDVDVHDMQSAILAQKGYIMPFLDCEPTSPLFKPIQRIGSLGILEGESRRVGWTNETHLHVDSLMRQSDLIPLAKIYGISLAKAEPDAPVYRSDIEQVILKAATATGVSLNDPYTRAGAALKAAGLEMPSFDAPVTRGQYAVVIDAILDPFNNLRVDHAGNLSKLSK